MAGMIEFVCRLPHLWMDNNLTHFQKAVFPKSEMVFQNPNNGIKFPKKVKMCPGTTLIWHILPKTKTTWYTSSMFRKPKQSQLLT